MWACEPDCSAQGSQKRELDPCSWGHRHCEPLHRVLEPELGSFTRALTLYSLNCSAISPGSVFLIIHPNFNFPEFIWCHVAKSFQFLSIAHSYPSWVFWNNITLIPMEMKHTVHQNVHSGEFAGNFCFGDLAEDFTINIHCFIIKITIISIAFWEKKFLPLRLPDSAIMLTLPSMWKNFFPF